MADLDFPDDDDHDFEDWLPGTYPALLVTDHYASGVYHSHSI